MAQQSRNAYRRQIIAEFERLFPHPLFRGLPVHGNAGWNPRRLLWVSVISGWLPGKTLGERFFAARRIVKFLHPKWVLPTSYNSFVEAQQRWWPLLQDRLMNQLRPDESLGDAWRIRGWLLLAVDGTRFECPRTTANEDGLAVSVFMKDRGRP